jgi:hypothetical protein
MRALLFRGQVNIEVPRADRRQYRAGLRANRQWMTHRLDAHPLNRNLPGIDRALHVGHHESGVHLIHLFILTGTRGRVRANGDLQMATAGFKPAVPDGLHGPSTRIGECRNRRQVRRQAQATRFTDFPADAALT